MDTRQIFKTEKIKFLGIIIDEHLNWKEHIAYVCNRVKKLSSIFFKVRYKISAPCLKQLYFAMVHSILQYGVEIYANCQQTYLNDLKILNNRILRTLQFGNMRTKVMDLYKSYNTFPVSVLHEFRLCVFVYKYINSPESLPVSFKNYFRLNLDVH